MQGGQEGPYLLHTQVTTFQTRPLSPREPEVIPKITKLLPRLVLITPKFHNQEPKDRQLSLQHQCVKIQKCPGWQPEHTKFQNTELALSKDYKN